MKKLSCLDKYRQRHPYTGVGDQGNGLFVIPFTGKISLVVMASDGMGWDHVSVSVPDRCPTWEEMSFIKRLFFENDECAVQYHPPVDDHISLHPFCLHLWRKQSGNFFMPPKEMIA